MKLLIPLLLLLCSTATAQQITETLYSFKKSYNPLFSNKAASLQIDLNKKYEVGGQDTTYVVVIDAKENVLETTSLYSFSTMEAINSYEVDRMKSTILLTPKEFLEFFDQTNKVYAYITTLKENKYKNSITASFDLKKLVIAGNHTPKVKPQFFFQVGNSPTFSADAVGILEIAKALRSVKGILPGIPGD